MQVDLTSIPEIKGVAPQPYVDAPGSLVESYRDTALRDCGLDGVFVQGNPAYPRAAGTIRDPQFKIPLFARAKLVPVVRRATLVVAVDVGLGSPTFGRHVGAMHGIAGLELRQGLKVAWV
jgi:dTDP-4-dehydrorhamnose 3,5-epimerase